MHTYRKKPVVIEAFQLTEARRWDHSEWPDWLRDAWATGSLHSDLSDGTGTRVEIDTLEGRLLVAWNDWIIQGIAGEIYPCRPDIFAATYDPVD